MPPDTAKLVELIAWCASERHEKLTSLQLVKFLYLLDYFYARHYKGETITNWPWRFVHFGPYCVEALQAGDVAARDNLVQKTPYRSKYSDDDKFLFSYSDREEPEEELPIAKSLPLAVLSDLKHAIRQWAGNTAELLDYVYFQTEPMQDIQPGAFLDFRKVHPPEEKQVVSMKALPKKKLLVARAALKALASRNEQTQTRIAEAYQRSIKDKFYFEALSVLDGAELETGLTGEAKLE